MKPASRECRYCNAPISWAGEGNWRDDKGVESCEGQPNGHRPDNKLRSEQKRAIGQLNIVNAAEE
jgi:hypothetical protein